MQKLPIMHCKSLPKGTDGDILLTVKSCWPIKNLKKGFCLFRLVVTQKEMMV